MKKQVKHIWDDDGLKREKKFMNKTFKRLSTGEGWERRLKDHILH